MTPKVTLTRRGYFSAGIQVWNPEWDAARNEAAFGRLASPHGHDYTVSVGYTGAVSPQTGMIVNLIDIKPVLAEVLARLDGKFLSTEVEHFATHRATVENIVDFIWHSLPTSIGDARLARVRLDESGRLWAEVSRTTMRLTRSYEFSAAHRLHTPSLPDETNTALYGKCNNLFGHGHNYRLEVTVEGQPDPDTGAIVDLDQLDAIVNEEVFGPFDHRHLNVDCPDFTDLVPTSENLAKVIYRRLDTSLSAAGKHLVKVGLHETSKNYFEVEG